MELALIWKALSSYGVLGVMCVVLMGVIVKLYRDRETERERHRVEMATYRDRYEAKAEKNAEKIADVVAAADRAADRAEAALERRRLARSTDVDAR